MIKFIFFGISLSLASPAPSQRPSNVAASSIATQSGESSFVVQRILSAESQVPDLKPGQGKQFFNLKSRKGPALVFVHGFSASPKEYFPTMEGLSEQVDGPLFLTRLKGHGQQSLNDLREARLEDWSRDVSEALDVGRQFSDRVVAIGSSTGASLLIPEVQRNPQGVAALVLLSPNFGLDRWDADFLLLPGARWWSEWLLGSTRAWSPLTELQKKYWTTEYPYRSVVEVMRSVRLAQQSIRTAIQVPVLVVYNPQDQVVSPRKIVSAFDKIKASAKRITPFAQAENDHVLGGDALSPTTTKALQGLILEFLTEMRIVTKN